MISLFLRVIHRWCFIGILNCLNTTKQQLDPASCTLLPLQHKHVCLIITLVWGVAMVLVRDFWSWRRQQLKVDVAINIFTAAVCTPSLFMIG
jgi:hypothetical protein